jgi:Glycosyl transferase family 90
LFYITVPIAANAADLLHKVIWLKKHQKLARKIALNGRNFGLSHLRYEDYLCYTASLLEAVGDVDIMEPSALIPFNATLIEKIY